MVTDATGAQPVVDEEFGRPSWAALVRWDVTGALVRYRVMAFIVGVGLILLVFVGMPLQFLAHKKVAVEIVGTLHGYLYLLYLVCAADLARRARWRLGRILAVVAAGFVPFLAFVAEHRVFRQMKTEHAEELAAEAASATGPEPSSDGRLPAGPVD